MKTVSACFLCACFALQARFGECQEGLICPAKPGELVDAYFSPGSNDGDASLPPLQSSQNIESIFEEARNVFGVSRIFWRGLQDEHYLKNQVFRPENFRSYDYWQWLRHLCLELQLNRVAVESAHRRGMAIWGYTGLFEFGNIPKEASYSAVEEGPAVSEDRARVQHPDWVPTDRYGIRRQSGPFEFAYSASRHLLLKSLVREVLRRNYDGLMLYTYVEATDLWFEDEFGFNEPVVREFRRRYGRDIRKEDFDREQWRRLRGEYVTQFLTELRAALHKHSKKLGIVLNASNPNLPEGWPRVAPQVPAAGRIYLDWEKWVRDHVVDEIMVDDNPGQLEFLPLAVAIGATNKVTVSALHPGSLSPELERPNCGAPRRVLSGKLPDWEWGYKQRQAPEAAESADPFARLRVLHQVEANQTTISFSCLQGLANDGNTLVRRETLRVLCQTGNPRAIATLEAALSDADHAVRCTAVIALRILNGPRTIEKIFSAIRLNGNYQFDAEATRTLAKLIDSDRLPMLLQGACDSNTRVRCAALSALHGKPIDSSALSCLLNGFDDPSPQVRWSAIIALTSQPESAPVVERLLGLLHDPHPTVRVAAAFALGQIAQTNASKVDPWQDRVLAALKQRFQSFGGSYRGSDRDWAFKSTGAALVRLGPNGQEVLRMFLNQRKDQRLADLAWRSLYLSQDGALRYHLSTSAEAEAAYQFHPKVRKSR